VIRRTVQGRKTGRRAWGTTTACAKAPKRAHRLAAVFRHPYGLGAGARLGYAFNTGVYAGAAYTHFFGPTGASHADFFGGELGYKFFPTARWELRPFVFAGPAFVATANDATRTDFAVQPSLLTGYHFGAAYISVEARGLVTPDPSAFALLGGLGIGL
jgi:hypothetical protein